MADSEAGSSQTWRLLKGTELFSTFATKKCWSSSCCPLSNKQELSGRTPCAYSKNPQQLEIDTLESCATPNCVDFWIYFFLSAFLCSPTRICKIKQRQIHHTAISASSHPVTSSVTLACPTRLCDTCWLVHAVRMICSLISGIFYNAKGSRCQFCADNIELFFSGWAFSVVSKF